jgi:hypothetical protein
MRFSVDQASFLAVLRRAAACASATSARFDERLLRLASTKAADGTDAIAVGATDGLLAYRGFVEGPEAGVTIDDPGLLLFEAKTLLDRIGRMPPGRITIGRAAPKPDAAPAKTAAAAAAAWIIPFTHATTKLRFTTGAVPDKGLPPIRWPDKSQVKSLADLSGETLARILTRAVWAAEPSDADAALNALVLWIDRDGVRVTAGTNRSVAVVELKDGGSALVHTHVDGAPWEGVLSLKSAKALIAFGQSVGPGTLSLTADAGQIVASYGTTRLGCALLALAVRDWYSVLGIVMRGTNVQELVVPKRALLEAVAATRMVLVATSDNPGLYLVAARAEGGAGALHLVAEGAGEAEDEIPTATPIVRPMAGQYLPGEIDEAVKACGGDEVSLLFCDAMGTPLLITDVDRGVQLSAILIGMVKYRSRRVDALLAAKVAAP